MAEVRGIFRRVFGGKEAPVAGEGRAPPPLRRRAAHGSSG